MRSRRIDIFSAFGIERNDNGWRIPERPGFTLGPAGKGRKIVINHILIQMLSNPAAGEYFQFQFRQPHGDGGIDIGRYQPDIGAAFQHIIGCSDIIARVELPERRGLIR